MIKRAILIISLALSLYASTLNELLEKYEDSQELSRITKKESAGFADVFTRKDLERMQVFRLRDILKVLPSLTPTLSANNISAFNVASFANINPTAVRIYINDHDITSTTFGSGFIVWGDMPLEYIDHVEIYRGSSSVEFGNEPAIIVIKIYTKLPDREVGSKLRLISDTKKSLGADFYTAKSDESDSVFFYLHQAHQGEKKYYHDNYKLSKDYRTRLFYANYSQERLQFEISHYRINKDPFLGRGVKFHPTGGNLGASHFYTTATYRIDRHKKIVASIDQINYDINYKDPDGIYTEAGIVRNFHLANMDKIFSLAYKENYTYGNFSWYGGGFVKHKSYEHHGRFDAFTSQAQNFLNLYSIFGDLHYRPNDRNWFIFSFKTDYYDFHKNIDNRFEYLLRASYIKQFGDKQLKLFYTKTYFPIAFYQLCSSQSLPARGNPDLEFPNITLYTAEFAKKSNPSGYMRIIHRRQKYRPIYLPDKGYLTSKKTINITHFELGQSLRYPSGKVEYALYKAINSENLHLSPDHGANLRWFHSTDRFDLYTELIYTSSYNFFGKKIDPSFGATLALKYHYNKDLSFGIKAINLFNKGFKQAYSKIPNPIEVESQKLMFNVEYLF